MRWKKKHEKHGYLSKKDGDSLQKMAIDAYMTEMLTTKQFDEVISKILISGTNFAYILDEIKIIYNTINHAFKIYDQQKR